MRPSERYQVLIEDINRFFKMLGLEILSVKLRFNYRTLILLGGFVSYTTFSIMWIIKQAEQSWLESLKASIMMGGMLIGATEVTTIWLKHSHIRHHMYAIRSIFEDYEDRNTSYLQIIKQGLDRVLRVLQVIRVGYGVSYSVMCLLPLGVLLYNGTRVTIVQYQLPGLSLDNNFVYAYTYFTHLLSMCIALVGFYAGDMMGCLALMQILTLSDIMQLKTRYLNEQLDRKVEARGVAAVGATLDAGIELEVQSKLLDAIKWHQYYTEYCREVDIIYNILITGQVFASGISILSTFCVTLSEFHLISVIYFLVSFYKMLVYCIVGTKIEYAHEQVYESICTINWYELSPAQRKLFGFMMKESQNTQTLIMVGIFPLSVRTALQITKLIYSVAMMMMQNRN